MSITIKHIIALVSLVMFICICRIVPHLANFSPMICVALFVGRFFNARVAAGLLVGAMLVSDVCLHYMSHYAVFGSWTFFVYTGLLATLLLGGRLYYLEERFSLGVLAVLGSAVGFWVWTNIGVWLFAGMYQHTLSGLAACYAAAIPFLQYNVLGSGLWYLVGFLVLRVVYAKKEDRLLANNKV